MGLSCQVGMCARTEGGGVKKRGESEGWRQRHIVQTGGDYRKIRATSDKCKRQRGWKMSACSPVSNLSICFTLSQTQVRIWLLARPV